MNYLTAGLKQAFYSIRKHKILFVLLVILQIAVLFTGVFLLLSYQLKILSEAQVIITSLSSANFNQQELQEGKIFLQDALNLYKSYNSMMSSLFWLGFWLFVLFLVGGGALWLLTHYLLEKSSWRKVLQQGLKYVTSTVVLLVPFFLITYFISRNLLALESSADYLNPVLISIAVLGLLVYYFLLAAFASLSAANWREFFKKIFVVGMKKAHKTLFLLVFIYLIIFLNLYLVYFLMNDEAWFFLALLASLLLVIVLVLARLFFVAAVKSYEKEHEKDNH